MNKNWYNLDNIGRIGDIVTSVHCDTRFFKVKVNSTKLSIIDSDENVYQRHNELYRKILDNETFDEKYIITKDELVPFFKKVRDIRDKAETIVLRFNIENCNFWLKYIRAFKLSDGRFVITNDARPFEWRKIDFETLDEFYKNNKKID